MPYCTRCGVEVEKYITQCPLCSADITDKAGNIKTSPGIYPDTVRYPDTLAPKTRIRLMREILNFSLLLSPVILIIIDFLLSHTFSWSLYAIASLFFCFIITNSFFHIRKHALIVMFVDIGSVAVFLFLLDFFDGKIDWFLIIGLPLTLLVSIVIAGLVVYIKRTHHSGLNIPAMFLLGVIVICIGIDFFISYYYKNAFTLSWSLIVAISSILPAALMLFIHYRIRKIDLEKTFHI